MSVLSQSHTPSFWLFCALGYLDLLIDKQELMSNKVLKANGLCWSDTMDVSVRRQFESKIFWFWPKNESCFSCEPLVSCPQIVGLQATTLNNLTFPFTLARSDLIRPERTSLFCHLRFGFVESFGFSAYLLSALRTSSFYIPWSIFDILLFSAIRIPSWSLPPVQASLFLCRGSSVLCPPSSRIQHPAL